MNLVVVTHPEAVAAAIELERRTEPATLERVFAEILAQQDATPDPSRPRRYQPWSGYEVRVLRRHREAVVPRLLAIAEGRGGEGEPARLHAGTMLCRVDPPLGFRALLTLLPSNDPTTLEHALNELSTLVFVAEDDGYRPADFAAGPADLDRITSLLDHPVDQVVHWAIGLLDQLKAPGFHDHWLVLRMDDPVHGKTVRRMVASEGRETGLLDRILARLATPGRADPDDEAVELLDRFCGSDDPLNAPRAAAMRRRLLEGDTLLPKERSSLERESGRAEHRREALRPEHLEKAVAQVDRLVAAGIIDRASADRAVAVLRADEEGNWELSDYWGTIEGLRAAGIVHGVNFKGSSYPPAHDELIRDLARISRGVFRPEGVYQFRAPWMDHGYDYPVQFVHGGRLYRLDIDYMGASYDATSVLEAANEALADAEVPGRFVVLGVPSPRDTGIAFCDPSAFEPIAGELGLKPVVPFATVLGSMARIGDASRHRIWDQIAFAIGDRGRRLSIEEIVRWRCPATGETALHLEAGAGHHDRVVVLLATGADVHARSSDGSTPLHSVMKAIWYERTRLIEALLRAGAEVDARASGGETPLHQFAREGDKWTATALLDRGADVNAADDRGRTPLDLALAVGRDEALPALLRERGGRSSA